MVSARQTPVTGSPHAGGVDGFPALYNPAGDRLQNDRDDVSPSLYIYRGPGCSTGAFEDNR